jgi:soluble lytic murein transglycosylase-like protein
MMIKLLAFSFLWALTALGYAATQQYQDISLSNRQELRQKFYSGASINSFKDVTHAITWIGQQSYQLRNKIPDDRKRRELLRMIHYEATRYQLDADLVLALIEVESGFNRFALSQVGASGLMQIMPFWKELIGSEKDSLFDVQTNLRYGCIILRHYLDVEKNNVERALARYNGSLGTDIYSSLVLNVWQVKYRFVGAS